MVEFLRIADGRVQTAVHTYRQPVCGRWVTLISTQHIGLPSYYARINKIIEAAAGDGASVYCEGSTWRAAEQEAGNTDAERQVLDEMARVHRQEKAWLDSLGWISQVDGLPDAPEWTVVDISVVQVAQMLPLDVVLARVRRYDHLFVGDPCDPQEQARFRDRFAAAAREAANTDSAASDPAAPVVLHRRTAIALEAVLAGTGDAVAVWGVGHGPGLDAGVRRRGFEHLSVDWLTAVDLNDSAFPAGPLP